LKVINARRLLYSEELIACTNLSTQRVNTAPIRAFWITATSACSEILRASEDSGNSCPAEALAPSGSAFQAGYRECGRDNRGARSRAALPVHGAIADQAVNIAFHHQLQVGFRNRTQQVALIMLLQKLSCATSTGSTRVSV